MRVNIALGLIGIILFAMLTPVNIPGLSSINILSPTKAYAVTVGELIDSGTISAEYMGGQTNIRATEIDNIYAYSYKWGNNNLKVATVEINDAGFIQGWVDSSTYSASATLGWNSDAPLWLNGDHYIVGRGYDAATNYGAAYAFTIQGAGAIPDGDCPTGSASIWGTASALVPFPRFVYIDSDTYGGICGDAWFNGENNGDGTLDAPNTTLTSGTGYYPSVWEIGSNANGVIVIADIHNATSIETWATALLPYDSAIAPTEIDTDAFDLSDIAEYEDDFTWVDEGSMACAVWSDNSGTEGWLRTFELASDGTIGNVITKLEWNAVGGIRSPKIIDMGDNNFILLYAHSTNGLTAQHVNIPDSGILNMDNFGDSSIITSQIDEPFQICPVDESAYRYAIKFNKNGVDRIYTIQLYPPTTVVMDSVLGISENSAVGYGSVTDNPNGEVFIERGFIYDTIGNPQYSGSRAYETGGWGSTFSYNLPITGLVADEKYYIKAYVASAASGTTISNNMLSFTTNPDYDDYRLKLEFEPPHIVGTMTGTIEDQSDDDNDATYIMASNPSGISGDIGPLVPTEETDARSITDAGSNLSDAWELPPEPDNMYQEGLAGDFGGIYKESVDDIASLAQLTAALVWALLATVILVMLGIGVLKVSKKSQVLVALTQGIGIILCYIMGIFPGWFALSYPFAALGFISARKFY